MILIETFVYANSAILPLIKADASPKWTMKGPISNKSICTRMYCHNLYTREEEEVGSKAAQLGA